MTDGLQPDTEYASEQDRFRTAAITQRQITRAEGAVVDAALLPRPRLSRRSRSAAGRGQRPHRPAWPTRRRRVPVRIQSQTSDCGPACLAMVLAYHGIDVAISELRREANAGRDGVSARVLLETARRYGVPGRGVRATINDLARLPAGTILFWNFAHFVVLERVVRGQVDVVDPALGRRRIDRATVSGAFTGVALEFQPPLADDIRTRPSLARLLSAGPWRYLGHFFPRDRSWAPLTGASMLLLLFNFVVPLTTAYLVEHAPAGSVPHGLAGLVAAMAAVVALFLMLQATRGLAVNSLQAVADKKVTLGVLHHLLSLPYDFFALRNAGDLAMRVRTTLAVRRVLTGSALSAVFDGLLILIYGALLLLADTKLALLVIGLAVLQVAVLLVAWRRQRHLMATTLDCESQSEGDLVEILEGIQTLKAAGLEGAAGERWSHTLTDEVNARTRSGRHFALTAGVSASLQFCAPLAVLALGAVQLGQHSTSLGDVVGFSALALGMFVPLTSLVVTGMQVAGLGRTLSRLGDILEAKPEDRALPTAPTQHGRGEVRVEELRFSYPGSRQEVLKGVSLTAAPGDFVAILGQSGSGKSTLATVLAGLYLPSHGRVIIDGAPTGQVDRTSLRRSISFVNQNARLFAGSIHDNIAAGRPEASHEEIVAATQLAEIHADIRALPMGLLTLLGPDGAGVSGGQRQRIALARALIRRPRLLILDEATSALDRATEERIFTNLLGLDCTLIVIAHRIAAAHRASEILVLQDGEVVQRGCHDELLSTAGPYSALTLASGAS